MQTTRPAVLEPGLGLALVPPRDEEAIGRSALRKASVRLLPMIGIGYCIAYMDRVNISFAASQMNRQLHFSATVFGLGAGLFFLSYAACEIPSNLLLVRFGARRWLARIMLTWGLISMAMIFVRTPLEFYAGRLLLGVAEAGFFPGVIFYLSQWFPAGERSRAVSRFYIALPLSSTIMGALAGSLLGLNGRLHLAGWQWLLLMEGLPAVLMSAVFMLMLPNSPAEAPWLSDPEREWIQGRLERERALRGGVRVEHHVTAAFRDVRVWLLGLFLLCLLLAIYAYTFIAPQLVQQVTGWDMRSVGVFIAALGVAWRGGDAAGRVAGGPDRQALRGDPGASRLSHGGLLRVRVVGACDDRAACAGGDHGRIYGSAGAGVGDSAGDSSGQVGGCRDCHDQHDFGAGRLSGAVLDGRDDRPDREFPAGITDPGCAHTGEHHRSQCHEAGTANGAESRGAVAGAAWACGICLRPLEQ